jgi:hypothetical protein
MALANSGLAAAVSENWVGLSRRPDARYEH